MLDFVLDPTTHHVASNWQTRCVALDTDLGNLAQQCPEEIFDQCIDSVATTLPNDEILEIAKQHLDEFMFVGITERFEESLAILTYLLGSAPAYAPRINVAPKTLSQTEAPLETRKVIAEHNQLDLALYEDAIGRFQVQFNEMLNDLLLSNYYQKWRTTSVYNIDYTFDQALNGSGWHDREQVEKNRYFRWTGLEDEATQLFNLGSERDLIVTIHVIHALNIDMATNLTLHVNERKIPLMHNVSQLGYQYTGRISKEVLQESYWGYAKFALRTPYRTSPKELSMSADARQLGVAVERIQISPA